jgi:GTP-binding protein Era
MAEIKKNKSWAPKKKTALTVPQQKALLNYVEESDTYSGWYPVITVLLGTGMRISECLGLRWDDLNFDAVVPVSALEKEGFAELQEEIVCRLPEGPSLFPEDELTDQPMRVIAAEMIREKVLRNTHDEVPHAIAVEVDEFKERSNGNIFIRATIFVERESQKGIVIGAKGGLLKKIGQEARQDIENLTGCGVFLDLWVKVQADWRNKSKMLKELGYKEP